MSGIPLLSTNTSTAKNNPVIVQIGNKSLKVTVEEASQNDIARARNPGSYTAPSTTLVSGGRRNKRKGTRRNKRKGTRRNKRKGTRRNKRKGTRRNKRN